MVPAPSACDTYDQSPLIKGLNQPFDPLSISVFKTAAMGETSFNHAMTVNAQFTLNMHIGKYQHINWSTKIQVNTTVRRATPQTPPTPRAHERTLLMMPLNSCISLQVPKYLSQQWDKAAEKGEVGKITIGKQVPQCGCVRISFQCQCCSDQLIVQQLF